MVQARLRNFRNPRCRVPVWQLSPAIRLAAVIVTAMTVANLAVTAYAQRGPVHYFQRADMPPGSVGSAQLQRGGPLPGYFQAVTFSAPEGTKSRWPQKVFSSHRRQHR